MPNYLKNNIYDIVYTFNPNIKISSTALRYLENIIFDFCKKYIYLLNKNNNSIKIVKKLFKKNMYNILIDLIIKRESLNNKNDTQIMYTIMWSNLKKKIDSNLGKRKRFDDNITATKIKKRLICDIKDELGYNNISQVTEIYNNNINNYKFKDWLNYKFDEQHDNTLSILSIIIEYICCEIIDVSIKYIKNSNTINKQNIKFSIENDNDLKYLIDKLVI